MYHNYVFFFFYVNMVSNVANELKDANDFLIEVINGTNTKQARDSRKIKFIQLNSWSTDDITQLTKRYRTIYEATESINNIFGWEILFFIGHAATVLLNLLYTSVWLMDQDIFESDDITALLCMNAVVALSTTVRSYLILDY